MIKKAIAQLISMKKVMLAGFLVGCLLGYACFLTFPKTFSSTSTFSVFNSNTGTLRADQIAGSLDNFISSQNGLKTIQDIIDNTNDIAGFSSKPTRSKIPIIVLERDTFRISSDGANFDVKSSSEKLETATIIAKLHSVILGASIKHYLQESLKGEIETLKTEKSQTSLILDAARTQYTSTESRSNLQSTILKAAKTIAQIRSGNTTTKRTDEQISLSNQKGRTLPPNLKQPQNDISSQIAQPIYESTKKLLSQFIDEKISEKKFTSLLLNFISTIRSVDLIRIQSDSQFGAVAKAEQRHTETSIKLIAAQKKLKESTYYAYQVENVKNTKITPSIPESRIPIFLSAGSILGMFLALGVSVAFANNDE